VSSGEGGVRVAVGGMSEGGMEVGCGPEQATSAIRVSINISRRVMALIIAQLLYPNLTLLFSHRERGWGGGLFSSSW
jgi:hypothetical protein